MRNGKLFGKCLAIGVIILFFSMASISALGESKIPKPLNMDPGAPIPDVFGLQGENGWYIDDVAISFIYDPKIVDEVYYYLNGDWHLYTGTFFVTEDGEHSIDWYWIDVEEGHTHYELPIVFKIDQSKPTVKLNKEIQMNNKVKFIATCNDDLSGGERVEFYLDDELITTSSEKPHEYVYSPDGSGPHEVYSIGYNGAGLSEQSETLDTKERSRSLDFPILNNFFQRIYYIIYLIQQVILN